MSSEQTFSTADLRSAARDSKREAARRRKWALGAVESVTRVDRNPRPRRPTDVKYDLKQREPKGAAVAALQSAIKQIRKNDMLEGAAALTSDESSGSDSDFGTPSPAPDAGVMYSFDARAGPSQGSQILNVALAQAVERFEERETLRLVKNEYDILDANGDSLSASPVKKAGRKAKPEPAVLVPDADEDYEFL